MTNFNKIEQTDAISNGKTDFKTLLLAQWKKQQEEESNYFSDNKAEEQEDDDKILSPAEYRAKLEAEKQEFNEVMQIFDDGYWTYLLSEDGDPSAMARLGNLNLGDRKFSNSANQAIYDDIVNIINKGLKHITNHNGSLNEKNVHDRLAENNQNMSEAQINDQVKKIAVNYN